MLAKLIFVFAVCACPALMEGSRILISSPYGTKSYHNMYVPLVTELSRRGHHITVITNYKSSELENTENVRQIVMDKLIIDMSPYPNPFDALLSTRLMLKSMSIGIASMYNQPRIITETMYEDERIKQLMAEDDFDLVMISITFNAGSYPLAWHFKAPIIMLTPNAIFPGVIEALGGEEEPSHIPFFLSRFTNKMNLLQRTVNTLATKLFGYFIHQCHHSTIHSIVKERVMPNIPPLEELEKNISLVFTNTHPVVNYARTMPPQIVEVGGMHCRPAQPLSQDLEEFVSNPFGFVLFAVGSMLPMEIMPEHLIQSFIHAFSRLPQRVIWQWKGKIRTDLPANVLAIPWLPQQDLLGHENCRLFITHGGLNSLQEAIYHDVPVLGLSFGTDQKLNVRRAVDDGYALKLSWTEINEETLTTAILDLLYNKKYSDAMRRQHELFHDQMHTPVERAVYWTEFVMRYNGIEHLQMASRNLASYQRALIDVYLVLILAATFPLVLTFFCLRKCCRRKLSKETKKNK
ncbi:UDP-glucosyltransferase 2-like [Daphnia carinata]|uniref:UDP-glucosyltransferase 2-like n=1 Tax=Daphnia carinata TaxID=120202 RepID=UPI00257AF1DF|nr:UDP-glucosyltransferase 2-like [Daphnia carinata]XP_059352152.1 UDP-glucosyltransferase 2-like [Daphnia carinata]